MLATLIGRHSYICSQMFSKQPIVVHRVSGQRDSLPPGKVTTTDWLRLLVREEALNRGARHAATEALERIRIKPGENYLFAAYRLVRAVRATSAHPDQPHVSEAEYFWSYAPVNLLQDLLFRFSEMIAPEAGDRGANEIIALFFSTRIVNDLVKYSIVHHRPKGTIMLKRGDIARKQFNLFVETLSHGRRRNVVTFPETP